MKSVKCEVGDIVAIKLRGKWAYSGHRLHGIDSSGVILKSVFSSGGILYALFRRSECRIIRGRKLFKIKLYENDTAIQCP